MISWGKRAHKTTHSRKPQKDTRSSKEQCHTDMSTKPLQDNKMQSALVMMQQYVQKMPEPVKLKHIASSYGSCNIRTNYT